MLNFTKIKVTFVYLILLTLIFFASLNLKFNNSIDKKINLGLDLQGGSYILLEVDTNPLIGAGPRSGESSGGQNESA